MVSTVQDFNKQKKLDVDSVSGTPTVDKATPIILKGSETFAAVVDGGDNLFRSSSVNYSVNVLKRGIIDEVAIDVDTNQTADVTVTIQDSSNNTLATNSGSFGESGGSVSFTESDYSRIPKNEIISVSIDADQTDDPLIVYTDTVGFSNDFFSIDSSEEPMIQDLSEPDAAFEFTSVPDGSTTGNGNIFIAWENVSDAQDIAVFDQNDNLLDYEIEELDTTAETAVLWCYNSWVRDGTTQAKVAYGDNSDNTDNSNTTGTWPTSDYQASYNLNESSGSTLDRTSNNSDSTNTIGTIYQDDGQFAKGRGFDGTDDSIDFGDTNWFESKDFTVSCWVKFESVPGSGNKVMLVDPGYDGNEDPPGLFYDNNDLTSQEGFVIRDFDGNNVVSITTNFTVLTETWYHVVATYDISANDGEIFVDAVSEGTGSLSSGDATNTEAYYFGSEEQGGQTEANESYLNGQMDEVQITATPESTDWIQADYDASPKAGQVFFSQQAAEDTVQITTDTAVTTSYTMSGETSTEVNNRFDTATTTTYNMTAQVSQETKTNFDTAVTTSYVMSPQTSTELNNAFDTATTSSYEMTALQSIEGENFTDTAVTTSYSMTAITSTESQVNVDTAVTSSYSMTPQTSSETVINVDTAVTASYTMAGQTSSELNNVTDTATTTNYTLTPSTTTEQNNRFDTAQPASYTMTGQQSVEFEVIQETAVTSSYSMTAQPSTELEIFFGANTLILESFEKRIVLETNTFKEGDTGKPYQATLKTGGQNRDLSNADTIEFYMKGRDGTLRVDGGSMSITNGGDGKVEYDWSQSDVEEPGIFRTEVVVNFDNGDTEKWPSDDYQVIEVEEDLED